VAYNAFISYSHAADGGLAPALQSALHRFAKPWYRLRALYVFRDKTSLSLNPALWGSIEAALSQSEFFVLLASPDAAASEWVRKEVDYWLKSKAASKLLIVVTDGEVAWDNASGDFDWAQTSAIPQNLRGAFNAEPFFLDLRWAKVSEHLSGTNPRFRDAIATIASALHDRPKDELVGEDVRQHRKATRLAGLASAALVALTVSAVVTAYFAVQQRNIATSRALSASSTSQLGQDPELSLLLAIEAARVARTEQAEDALRQSVRQSFVHAIFAGHSDRVLRARFDHQGTRVVTASMDGTARIWNADTGNEIALLLGHADRVTDASYSPDGRSVVTASYDGTARLWDAETGDEMFVLGGHSREVYTAAFSSDGERVVTASFDGTARIWNASTGTALITLTGHERELWEAMFSPSGELVVTASRDGTARIWDSSSGVDVAELRGHTDEVVRALFSPYGEHVVTVSSDRTARV